MQSPITALYAGLLAVLIIALSARITRLRWHHQVGIGDGGHRDLARAIRVHANSVEYVPLGLVLMLIAELNGFSAWLLHVAGSALFLGRVLHAAGLGRSVGTTPERMIGTTLTWLVIGGLGVTLLVSAFI